MHTRRTSRYGHRARGTATTSRAFVLHSRSANLLSDSVLRRKRSLVERIGSPRCIPHGRASSVTLGRRRRRRRGDGRREVESGGGRRRRRWQRAHRSPPTRAARARRRTGAPRRREPRHAPRVLGPQSPARLAGVVAGAPGARNMPRWLER